MIKWSIIIFCYNEVDSIAKVIEGALKFVSDENRKGSEIILVDDGSSDGTEIICRQYAGKTSLIRLIHHEQNSGIGAALQAGYLAARGQQVCAIPGDGQFNIVELEKIGYLEEKTFVSFYRIRKYYSLYRQLLTTFNNLFNLFFLGITLKDVNWIKVYTLHQLKCVDFQLKSSLIESEISAKLLKSGYKIIELPSEYLPRSGGESKGGSIKTITKAAKDLWLLWKCVHSFEKRKL